MCRPAELWRQSAPGRQCAVLCNACTFAECGHKGAPLYSGGVLNCTSLQDSSTVHLHYKQVLLLTCIAGWPERYTQNRHRSVVLPKLGLHADMRKGCCLRPTAVQAGGYGRAKNLAAVLPIYLAAVLPMYLAAVLPEALLDADMLNTLTQSLTRTPAHGPHALQLMLRCSRPSLYRALLAQSSRCSSPTRRARSTSPAPNTPMCYRGARRRCWRFWGGVAHLHSNH